MSMASDRESQLLQLCIDGNLPALKDLITKKELNPNEVKDSSGLTLLHLACQHGHLNIVQYLIKNQKCNAETTTPNGRTPLHIACKSGHLHILKCLIADHKCDPHCTDNDGYTPLHAASENGNIETVKYLITEQGCDPQVVDSIGNTPLHYASESGHLHIVQDLTTNFNCNPQKANSRGSIPLHYACKGGQIAVARYLIDEHSCNPQIANNNGLTPLHCACLNGHLTVVKYLISELGCNPQIPDNDGYTPLHYACLKGHLDVTKKLISDCNCNPQCSANNGNTPLHLACQNGHLQVGKYLITEQKCTPEHGNVSGYTPLHSAAGNGRLAVVKYLISELGFNAQITTNNGLTPLHYACLNGHLDITKYLISDCNCNPQCSANNGNTPLHCACENGHLEVAKYLITEQKCAPEHGNVSGYTPLHLAAGNGHQAVVKYLISELGCNPQVTTNNGLTLLHYACLNGHLDITKYLISDCNCNPQCSANNGNTPLHCACENGHLEVAKYLITEQKCAPEHGNVSGYTPLHLAATNGHLTVVKYLISELGCNPQIPDNDGYTPLHYACLKGHLDVTKKLISDCNCNPQCSANNGNTPLHLACQNGHLQVGKYLITEQKCTPEHGNVSGYTPLHSAAGNGRLAVVKYLISELGFNAQITTNNGLTLLHYACLNGHLDITKYLISDCNCNPQCSANNGNTPLHCACENGHLIIVKYLTTQCNCNPQCSDINAVTPLHLACESGHLHIVKYLLEEQRCQHEPQAKLNLVTETLNLPLHIRSNLKTFQPFLLINDGFTPLHSACSGGQLDIVKYLIDVGKCNPNHSTSNGLTAIDFAQRSGHQEVVVYLRNEHQSSLSLDRVLYRALSQGLYNRYGKNFDSLVPNVDVSDLSLPLQQACWIGDLPAVRFYITQCNYNPSVGFLGFTPLHTACMMGHLRIAKYLISELGCDPQIADNEGSTPLHCACLNGHLDIAKYLISNCNCDPECTNKFGDTPLHCACENGCHNVAKYLITEYKCSPEHGNFNGCTPLHSAAFTGHLAVVKYLIGELGCNPQIADSNGATLLHFSCLNGHLDLANYFISECKCNPQHSDKNGNTPLHCACENGYLEVVKYLITEHKCSPEHANVNGYTPLHSAAYGGHLAVMKYLITKHNCNPQCSDINGFTPLHAACESGQLHVAEYLIHQRKCPHEPKAKVTWLQHTLFKPIYNFDRLTPLHSASRGGHLDTVKYLIDVCHCNPHHSTTNNFTAIDFAQMFGHKEVVSYFRNEHQCSETLNQVFTAIARSELHILFNTKPSQMLLQYYDSCFNFNDIHISRLEIACFNGNLAEVILYSAHFNYNFSSTGFLGLTPLHIACMTSHLETAKYLVTKCNCDPNCVIIKSCHHQTKITPLCLATAYGQLEVVRWLVSEQKCEPVHRFTCPNYHKEYSVSLYLAACLFGHLSVMRYLMSESDFQDLDTLLLLLYACQFGHLNIVEYLINEQECSLCFTFRDGSTLLHHTCGGISFFLETEHLSAMNSTSTVSMHGISRLMHILYTIIVSLFPSFACEISNPANELSNHDMTNHKEQQTAAYNYRPLDVVKYLISEHQCNPQCTDKEGLTPLHYACAGGQLEIVKYFHDEELSGLVHKAHSGDTPLHFACKYNQVEVVKFLLSTGECDPLIKNAEGLTPVELATSQEISEQLDHFCKGKYPLESVVKVFVLGDPMAGKSSLVQAIQINPGFLDSLIGRFQKVKGVRQQTVGIDSFHFSSSDFGNVVIYDFAGQREFYTSHAAFLQNYSIYMEGIFIVVTNIALCEDDICQTLQYWMSFIQDCCTHNQVKSPVIVVGSHADLLDDMDVDKAFTIIQQTGFFEHSDDTEQFYEPEGIVCLDCTRSISPDLDLLRSYLQQSCDSVRDSTEKIDQRCYVLHKYVWKKYTASSTQEQTLGNISNGLENNKYLLPTDPAELLPLFQTLHDKGQLIFLQNAEKIQDSWVITNISTLFETVVGSIFAPRDFPQHISPGSTGIVPKSKMINHFPRLNIDMVIGFLEHFEFCHQVQSEWISDSQPNQVFSDDEYYLFPALVTSENTCQVSQESHEHFYYCKWYMYCTAEHFFTARFLQVLLLRLAFRFSLSQDDATSSSRKSKTPALSRRCNMWKNGICWSNTNDVKAIFELKDLKTATLNMICKAGGEIQCVRLRTELIKAILKAKDDFCPRVHVEECLMELASGHDGGDLQCIAEFSHSIKDLSRTIADRNSNDCPDLTLIHHDGSTGKRVSEVLYFEPYAVLTPDLIKILFEKENAKKLVSSSFITELASRMYPFNDSLEEILRPDPSVLSEKYKKVHSDSLSTISKQQLRCKCILEAWMEQQQPAATYKRLQQELNEYSIFCGRNPLNLVCKNHYFSE